MVCVKCIDDSTPVLIYETTNDGYLQNENLMVWSEFFVNSCISMEKPGNEQFVNVCFLIEKKKTVHYRKLHNVFEWGKWSQLVRSHN